MSSSTTGERVTAVVSVLVAIALLGAVVTAQQTRRLDGDDLVRLESDLRFQLDLIARFDGAAHKARLAQLEAVLHAWRQSMQTPADRRLLTRWFEEAIGATVSNSAAALPPAPVLGATPPIIVATAPSPVDEPGTPEAASPQTAEETPPVPEAKADPSGEEAEPSPAVVAEHSIAQLEPPPTEGLPYATAGDQDANADAAEAAIPPVQINLAELAARIRGYHQSLDDIDAVLVADKQLPVERLEAIVAHLETLAVQHRFLRLYYDSLTDDERRLVGEPRSMASTIRFAAAQSAAEPADDDFLAEFAALPSDEPTLAKRLATLADLFASPQDDAQADADPAAR